MLPMQPKQPAMPEADTDLGDASMMNDADDEQPSPDGAGYMIAWKVKPDGSMSVCQKPLPPEEDGQSAYREIPVKNEEQALKAALKIYQENPMSGDERAGFDAGFASTPESVPG